LLTALEAVRMLQAIEERNRGSYRELQQIAESFPTHVTATMVAEYGEGLAMIGAARLQLQGAAGIAPTDDRL
jgi:hypothetical protein